MATSKGGSKGRGGKKSGSSKKKKEEVKGTGVEADVAAEVVTPAPVNEVEPAVTAEGETPLNGGADETVPPAVVMEERYISMVNELQEVMERLELTQLLYNELSAENSRLRDVNDQVLEKVEELEQVQRQAEDMSNPDASREKLTAKLEDLEKSYKALSDEYDRTDKELKAAQEMILQMSSGKAESEERAKAATDSMKELQDQNQSLLERLEQQESAVNSAKATSEELEQKIKLQEQDAEAIRKLEEQNSELRTKLEQIAAELEEAKKISADAGQEQSEAGKAELDRLQFEVTDLEARLDKTTTEMASERAESAKTIESLQKERTEATGEVAALTEQLGKVKELLPDASGAKESSPALAGVTGANESATPPPLSVPADLQDAGAADELRAYIAQLQGASETQQERAAELQKQVDELKANMAAAGDAQAKVDALEEKLVQAEKAREDVLKEKAEVQKQVDELNATNAAAGEAQAKVDALEEKLVQAQKAHEDLLKEKANVQKQVDALEDKLQQAQKAQEDVQREVEAMKAEAAKVGTLEEKLVQAQKAREDVLQEKADVQKQVDALEEKLVQAQKAQQDVQAGLDNSKRALTEAEARVKEYEAKVEAMKAEAAEAEAAKAPAAAPSLIAELEAQISEYKAKLEAMQTEPAESARPRSVTVDSDEIPEGLDEAKAALKQSKAEVKGLQSSMNEERESMELKLKELETALSIEVHHAKQKALRGAGIGAVAAGATIVLLQTVFKRN